MTAIPKSDCQGEDPIMILVERLRQSARISTAPEMSPQGFPIEKNLYWRAAEAMLSLAQERDRLKQALQPFAKAADLCEAMVELERYSFSNQELHAARAALHKDQAS
jgi:hypothetical protein